MAKVCQYCGEPIPLTRRVMGKDLHAECEKRQQELLLSYEQVLRQAIRNRDLTQATADQLTQVVAAGRFQATQLRETNLRIYASLKDAILADGDFPQAERDFLWQLQCFLRLSDEEADAHHLNHLRRLAWIMEGNLPEIAASVNLTKGEVAHWEGPVTWKHLKTRTKRVAGTRAQSVRIAKGVSFKVGGTSGRTEQWQEFQTVDEGKAIITSQRLLFVGANKNLNIKHEKILDLELYSDAIQIHRGTVNPTHFFMEDPTTFYTVLSTALAEQAA